MNLKYFKKANIYKNYNGNVSYDPETGDAYSYAWWKFVMRDKNLVIFNRYRYSPTTCTHQSAVDSLLTELGIEIAHNIVCPAGFQSVNAKQSAIKYYKAEIKKLEAEIAKPRSQKRKNSERLEIITGYNAFIELAKKVL